MSVPGINVFRLATKLIRKQPIQYYEYKGREPDKQRNLVSVYSDPIPLLASVQAVLRSQYVEMGLQLQKNYVKIFIDKDIVDLERDASGDYFKFGGRTYKMEDETTWFLQDGWAACLAVEVKQSFPVSP